MVNLFCKNFDKMARWLLYLPVITIPVQALPMAYPIPRFLRDMSFTFFVLLFMACVVRFFWERKRFEKWPLWVKGYLMAVCVWPFLCTFMGALSFPYWDETVNEFLRQTWLVQKIAGFYPGILTNETLLHLKCANSFMLSIVTGLLLPLLGIFFSLYVMFYGKDSRYILDTVSRAVVVLTVALCAYSVIEIPWLLTGNDFCAQILKWINIHLYDIETTHEWWPPLLWKGQLRSFTREPSFFGIISTFIVPFLWYRAIALREKKIWVLLVLFCYMIFMSRARTAQVIFLGEIGLLALFSVWGRYPGWRKCLLGVFMSSVLAFSAYLYVPVIISWGEPTKVSAKTTVETYWKEDVASAVKVSKRSNSARLGNAIALFSVGIEHPIFGVGAGFTDPYMADRFPKFTSDNQEVQRWIAMLREEGFLKSPIPKLNMLGIMICRYGIPGLLLFLVPLGMVGVFFLKNSKKLLGDFGVVCILIALGGQVACLFSNIIFYTYPLALSAALLLMGRILKERVAVHSGDNDFGESI